MIQIKNLSCGYNKIAVVNNISIDISKGAFIGIIGKNGAGKTTLLKSLSGLLKPYSGNIFLNGTDIYKMKRNLLAKKLSFMPQNMPLDFPFIVKDFIMFGRFPHMNFFKYALKQDYEKIKEIMDFTETKEFAERNILELSGGERQKVLIAQTLAQETDIIAFDEPTSHLDIGSQSSIFRLLRILNKKHDKTIITTIHDLNAAGEFCSNLILMDKGTIFSSGTATEVLNYKDIETVYNTTVVVKTNPVSNKPVVIPVFSDNK